MLVGRAGERGGRNEAQVISWVRLGLCREAEIGHDYDLLAEIGPRGGGARTRARNTHGHHH